MEPTEERANIQRKERYVSLEAVLKCVDEDGYAGEYDLGYGHHNLEFQELIKEIPAADVRPVVRGKWIHKPGCDGEWICNQCSHELEFIDGRTFGMPNYCPNCGAEMRERDGGRTEADPSTASRSPSPCQGRSGRETGDAGRQTRRRDGGDAGLYGGADDGRD